MVCIASATCEVTGLLNAAYTTQILLGIELSTGDVFRASPAALSTNILLGIETFTRGVIWFLYLACTTQVLVVIALSTSDVLRASLAVKFEFQLRPIILILWSASRALPAM